MSGILHSVIACVAGVQPPGQVVFEESGIFIVPQGRTSLAAVAVGRGGIAYDGDSYASNGGGGALSYLNGIAVTPGEALTITINASYSRISRDGTTLLSANAGTNGVGGAADTTNGATSFPGGSGRKAGGAGGYAGAGGGNSAATGGAAGSGTEMFASNPFYGGGGGGGVGLLGQGTSGAAASSLGQGGERGSGGTDGSSTSNVNGANGGKYGGGAGGGAYNDNTATAGVAGVPGAGGIRIIWGAGRAFPSTNTGDV